ncbi:MAG TPA: CusA/CzcA family heavy metal efflux RND transporter [Pseudomonadota bacterium]|nr:CusA/CzcA family heavy metal efflux RND transporter [Pseudomonadota bacterium]
MRLLGWLISASLRQRALVICATLLFILFGLRAAWELPMDAVPDVTNVQVQILTSAPALSPVEMEQYVTIPVERAMSGLPHLREMRSISKYGLSLVTVVFSDDTDIYLARQLVSERMRDAEQNIPRRYGQPQIGPLSTGLGEIFQFVVHAPSMMQAVETLDWYIGPQLRTVPGIVELNSHGGEQKEFQIILHPGRLQAAGLSVTQVVSALERSNANAGGGYLVHNREQYVIGAIGLIRSLDDLRSVVIAATPQGVPITVAQLGEVRVGPGLRRGAASMDGQGEVAVGVALMLRGENARTVTQAVKAKLQSLSASLPAGVRVEPFYDRSTLVDRVIRTVTTNLIEGAALVILVLLVLLGDVWAGLIVACTIPLSMLFALLCLKILGGSGNLMSLGAVDFGLIVDGAVIVVENVVRRLAEAQRARPSPLSADERREVVAAAATEVRAATVFGEAIIAMVYVPILSLTGIEGKLFHPMATTVLCALLGAMLCSLTIVPALCSLLLRPRPQHQDGVILRTLSRLYEPLLGLSLRRRGLALSLLAGLLLLGLGIGSRLGAEFVPQLDEGSLLVETRRLPGVALSESVAIDQRIARALRAPIVPEIEHVVARAGSPALANDVMGIEESDNYLILKPHEDWRPGLTRAGLAAEIETRLAEAVPDAAIAISQPIEMRTNELVAGVKSDVAAALYGPDLSELKRLGEAVERALQGMPGVAGLRVEPSAGLNYLRIYPDRARLARYGLSLDEVSELTQSLAAGVPVGQVFEGERRFPLVVKVDASFEGTLDPLGNLPLKAATGQIVPLGDVANIVTEPGPVQVARENQSRHLRVEFNVAGRDLLSVVREAQGRVSTGVKLPPGYRVEWGGQFEHYLDARARLSVVVPLAIALILFLLWLALGALPPALVILANVPFAAVGGVLALWLRGMPFSISAGVGFIALFGVAVLNGLVLVSVSHRLEAGGLPPAEAIMQAARARLRPVLMTALVAGLGFVPMALSGAPGSEVQRPLATVVIGGLSSSTLLTLLLLPTLYSLFIRARRTASPSSDAQPAVTP